MSLPGIVQLAFPKLEDDLAFAWKRSKLDAAVTAPTQIVIGEFSWVSLTDEEQSQLVVELERRARVVLNRLLPLGAFPYDVEVARGNPGRSYLTIGRRPASMFGRVTAAITARAASYLAPRKARVLTPA